MFADFHNGSDQCVSWLTTSISSRCGSLRPRADAQQHMVISFAVACMADGGSAVLASSNGFPVQPYSTYLPISNKCQQGKKEGWSALVLYHTRYWGQSSMRVRASCEDFFHARPRIRLGQPENACVLHILSPSARQRNWLEVPLPIALVTYCLVLQKLETGRLTDKKAGSYSPTMQLLRAWIYIWEILGCLRAMLNYSGSMIGAISGR